MLTAEVGQDGRSREEVFALQDERDAIQQRMSDQDLANLTPGQKQQADALMKRGGAEASEGEVDFQAAKARYEQEEPSSSSLRTPIINGTCSGI